MFGGAGAEPSHRRWPIISGGVIPPPLLRPSRAPPMRPAITLAITSKPTPAPSSTASTATGAPRYAHGQAQQMRHPAACGQAAGEAAANERVRARPLREGTLLAARHVQA